MAEVHLGHTTTRLVRPRRCSRPALQRTERGDAPDVFRWRPLAACSVRRPLSNNRPVRGSQRTVRRPLLSVGACAQVHSCAPAQSARRRLSRPPSRDPPAKTCRLKTTTADLHACGEPTTDTDRQRRRRAEAHGDARKCARDGCRGGSRGAGSAGTPSVWCSQTVCDAGPAGRAGNVECWRGDIAGTRPRRVWL